MWKNYLKIAVRNLWKQRSFSAINMLGMSIGMACCFVIIQFISFETSYDQHHEKGDRLYSMIYKMRGTTHDRVPPALSPKLVEYFPEIETAARLYARNLSLRVPNTPQQFEVTQAHFVDTTITRMFSFDFLRGSAKTALAEPFSVVLSESLALRFFGTTDILDRKVQLADNKNFRITGVFADLPKASTLDLKLLVNYQNMVDVEPVHAQDRLSQILTRNWTATHSMTYVLLKPGQSLAQVNSKFRGFIDQFGDERLKATQDFSLFPIESYHLYAPTVPSSNLNNLYVYGGLAILILLIACINFINLSTAASLQRAKEVGVRKVLGARRRSLVFQFLGETLLLSFIAFLLSLVLVRLALPYVNSLTGLSMVFAPFSDPPLLLSYLIIFGLTGILAGSYPALFVSNFKPINALKTAGAAQQAGGINLRKALITLQFSAAIIFISVAMIIFLQLNYLRNQPLGFEQDLSLMIPIDSRQNLNSVFRGGDAKIRQRMNTFDELLLQHPNIKAVTQCSRPPGLGAIGRNVWTKEIPPEDNFFARVLAVDYDFVETFNLELVRGRDFDATFGTDHLSSFVINETAIPALGWKDIDEAIENELEVEGKKGKVIGILKDFHFSSLYSPINPLILEVQPGAFSYFGIRLENNQAALATIAFIKENWGNFFPEKVFEFEFLDQSIADQYQREVRLMSFVRYFAFIAVFIACFGLFGLAALITQQRFKEIGIRKILGASVFQILRLLAVDYLKLIGIAMFFAVPLSWYLVNNWMENFSYRIPFPWWVPITSGLLVILIAFLTISSQAIKAAWSNPVNALRYE